MTNITLTTITGTHILGTSFRPVTAIIYIMSVHVQNQGCECIEEVCPALERSVHVFTNESNTICS